MQRMSDDRLDILIAGGGYVGLPRPWRSSRRARHLRFASSTPRRPAAGERDERASAIAAAARRMLEQLGVWDEIAAAGAADHRDGRHRFAHRRRGAAGVPDLRRRGRRTGEPFAHMVPNAP